MLRYVVQKSCSHSSHSHFTTKCLQAMFSLINYTWRKSSLINIFNLTLCAFGMATISAYFHLELRHACRIDDVTRPAGNGAKNLNTQLCKTFASGLISAQKLHSHLSCILIKFVNYWSRRQRSFWSNQLCVIRKLKKETFKKNLPQLFFLVRQNRCEIPAY